MIAAGIILRAPSGRVLVLKRSGDSDAPGTWGLPGGKMEKGESIETTAVRETLEEVGYLVGTPGKVLMTSTGDVQFTTFLRDVEDEFIPKLNEEHTAWAWVDPKELV